MKRGKIDGRVWYFLTGFVAVVLVSLALLSGPLARGQAGAPQTPLAKVGQDLPDKPAVKPAEPQSELARGVQAAEKGDFALALQLVRQAAKTNPADPKAQTALALLEAHDAQSRRDEQVRVAEYKRNVRRVEWCLAADSDRDAVTKDKAGYEAVRTKIRAVSDAYDAMPLTTKLQYAELKGVPALQAEAVKALATLDKALGEAAAAWAAWKGPYAQALAEAGKAMGSEIASSRKAWQETKIDTETARRAALDVLRDREVDLAEAISDLEAMVAEKPWQEALIRARTTELFSRASDKIGEQDWYKKVLAEGDRRGKAAIADAKWYDALAAYASLEALEESNETYKRTAKAVRQHVRVLGLYGNGAGASELAGAKPKKRGAASSAAEEDSPEAATTWKDMVAQIDAHMVKKAIARIKDNYVTTVDFVKVTRGALEALRILAETPQAAKAFPKLADAGKRAEFVKAINERIRQVELRKAVDDPDLELTLALDAMLLASEKTVEIPTEVIVMEFTDGALGELDKFSSMIWPYDVADFVKGTMGHFCGVGVQITKEQGEPLKVVTPLPDTPGYLAGIKPGDLILAVDGDGKGLQNTLKLSVDKCVRLITGPENTKVIMRISRPGVPKPFDLSVVRKEIQIRTVRGWKCLSGGDWDYMIDPAAKIGYVRISQFTKTTDEDLDKVLQDLHKAGMKSLVLDLRGNPGGLLNVATEVVDEFVGSGQIVLTRGRQYARSRVDAKKGGEFLDGDVIVLVNQYSASAAEIVAGAMQNLGRCLVLGKRSYGKGSVQNVIPLPGHEAFLKLTTAHYFVGPDEKLLHRTEGAKTWGVEPEVHVDLTPDQARHWVEMRHKTDIIEDVDPAVMQKELDQQFQVDVQLNSAVLLLKLNQLTGGKLAG